MVSAWQAFVAQVDNPQNPWLRAERYRGGDAALAAYASVLGGKADPRVGAIVALD